MVLDSSPKAHNDNFFKICLIWLLNLFYDKIPIILKTFKNKLSNHNKKSILDFLFKQAYEINSFKPLLKTARPEPDFVYFKI